MHYGLNYSFDDEDIICFVDEDDELSNNFVFSILNEVYKEESILWTYGSMYTTEKATVFEKPYSFEEYKNLRFSTWKISPLRSFKYKLFKEYIREDPNLNYLRTPHGALIRMPSDMAIFFPLLELTGFDNIKYLV